MNSPGISLATSGRDQVDGVALIAEFDQARRHSIGGVGMHPKEVVRVRPAHRNHAVAAS